MALAPARLIERSASSAADHRVLSADLVGKSRYLEFIAHAPNDIEVWHCGLHHNEICTFCKIEVHFA
jgi:hypothetical protein